ncbi:MAG TPA: outer membrane beta-barrel protein [Gemmatimonadaceae bacterium]|nr:outer membrane beta-barrel protein [Gemmatimonadaceae bacterium]
MVSGAAVARAQISSPVGVGVVGGTSSPTGSLSDIAKSGWHAGAFVELKVPVIPVGFRLEGAWHQFGDKPIGSGGGTTGARVVAVTLNATYDLLPIPIIKPYLIGGVGEYGARLTTFHPLPPSQGVASTAFPTNTETKFGVNGGAGVRLQFGGFAAFVEARWHDVFTSGKNVQMVPVSVGLRF